MAYEANTNSFNLKCNSQFETILGGGNERVRTNSNKKMLPQQESLHEQEEVNSNSIMEDAIVEAFENDDDYITDPTVNIDNFDTLSLSSLSSLVIGSNKSHHDSMTWSSSLLEEHHELLLNSSRNIIANSFNELPNEILVHILIYLNGAQIIKLECLSKRFYQLIHHEDE